MPNLPLYFIIYKLSYLDCIFKNSTESRLIGHAITLIISLRINYKSYYFVYLQASNMSYPLISPLFCSNTPTCSPSPRNSDPRSGPHLSHEIPRVTYFVFSCYLYGFSIIIILSSEPLTSIWTACLLCLIVVWFRTLYHLGQLLKDRGEILLVSRRAENTLVLWQWRLLHKALLNPLLWVERRSREWQIIARTF